MSLIAAFGSAPLDAVARQAITSDEAATGEADLGQLGGRALLGRRGAARSGRPRPLPARHHRPAPDGAGAARLRREHQPRAAHAADLDQAAGRDPDLRCRRRPDDDDSDFATQIEREVDHLAQLVDELLDLSMIESGATALAIEASDPETVVAACVERITPGRRASRDHASTASRSDANARSRARSADPGRLGQALLNLAHNAVKYSHHGGEVRIGWERDRRPGPVHRRRRRHRHPRRAPGAHLRALLQGRSLPSPRRRTSSSSAAAPASAWRSCATSPRRTAARSASAPKRESARRSGSRSRAPATRRLNSRCRCRPAAAVARGSRRRRADHPRRS